eukprot:sb/3479137/
MLYDGKDMSTAKMIAQLSGTLKEKTYTASTTAGLTLVIMTSSTDKSTGLSFEIRQVGAAGAFTETSCATGYKNKVLYVFIRNRPKQVNNQSELVI